MSKIKVGIIGTGNCATSLVEGVQFYSENSEKTTGVMKADIGGYLAGDVEFVVGFDIDERKIGLPLGEALRQKPNCSWNIVFPVLSSWLEVLTTSSSFSRRS